MDRNIKSLEVRLFLMTIFFKKSMSLPTSFTLRIRTFLDSNLILIRSGFSWPSTDDPMLYESGFHQGFSELRKRVPPMTSKI